MVPIERVYKYQFTVNDDVEIDMPQGAKILLVECQDGEPCIWAQVDPTNANQRRYFRAYGTGHPIDWTQSPKHVASFQQPPYVWHLYEVQP